MASGEQSYGDVDHAHNRLDSHDERLTRLERWKERVMGAILTLAFILGSGGVMGLVLEYFFS